MRSNGISSSDMSNTWDVIIIGGGPAGSSAACTLRKAGRKVLVLEKEKFPRFHIGESILPRNVPLIKEQLKLDDGQITVVENFVVDYESTFTAASDKASERG